jgi:glycosyltransferase involved in cell wall biosynthesis
MKTVLVDCLVLNGSHSGYRRIIVNLINRIQGEADRRYRYIFVFQRSGFDSLDVKCSEGVHCSFIIFPSMSSKWLRGIVEQMIVPLIAAIKRVNIIFMPCTFGLVFPGRPTLTFVHTNTSFAMSAKLRGRGTLQQFVHNYLIRMTARTSTALVFTTRQTMIEFMTYTGCDPKRGRLLGNGVVLRRFPSSPWWAMQPLSQSRYLLSVSQLYRLKNFDTLIRGFRRMKNAESCWKDLRLAIVGTIQESDYYAELLDLAAESDDVVFFHDLSDAKLDALYRHATLYCQMSYFEGYSLTPAEALLHGIPVLISNIPAHREVYEDIVSYADPHSEVDVAAQISHALNQRSGLDPNKLCQATSKFGFESFFTRLEDTLDDTLVRSNNIRQ